MDLKKHNSFSVKVPPQVGVKCSALFSVNPYLVGHSCNPHHQLLMPLICRHDQCSGSQQLQMMSSDGATICNSGDLSVTVDQKVQSTLRTIPLLGQSQPELIIQSLGWTCKNQPNYNYPL